MLTTSVSLLSLLLLLPVTASALQLEPLDSTSLVADADFDQLLHSLSLVSPTANNGSADASIGPCSALTLSPRGDDEGEEEGIGESQFPTVVSQSRYYLLTTANYC
jgi:hypothetical protein